MKKGQRQDPKRGLGKYPKEADREPEYPKASECEPKYPKEPNGEEKIEFQAKQEAKETTYLTDEQLQRLIMDVEEHEMVAAPPDLMDTILRKAKAAPIAAPCENPAAGKREFRRYCIRVMVSVAASIALLFAIPELSSAGEPQPQLPTKAEVMAREGCRTREEVMDASGIWANLFGGSHIFGREDSLHIFDGKSGG